MIINLSLIRHINRALSLRPVYTKRQWLIWSVSVNTCVISDQFGLQPIFRATGLFYYRPQRSSGKVMFLHLYVILFTGGGGVVWQTLHPSRHPLAGHPQRRPLQRTVRILLECILVEKSKQFHQSDIASDVAALTRRLGVNEPLYFVVGFRPWLGWLTDCAIVKNSPFTVSHLRQQNLTLENK